MNVFELIFIFPLRFVMDLVLRGSFSVTGSVGISIVLLSVAVNTALLPLYYLAEKWQNKERDVQRRMAPRLAEIKKQYKGEARYDKTAELYNEFSYHPAKSLRTSFGFLIQVPFFIAAYTLLSHNPLLEGASFLFLKNLGTPDRLISLGGFTINLMPLLMTLFNFISSSVYSKSLTRGEKVKLVLIALVFLVLLYNSPSGLVMYWTLNNVYSLVKNVIHNPVIPGAAVSVAIGSGEAKS